jgi:phosphoribosyl-dephospho-CoA transferase
VRVDGAAVNWRELHSGSSDVLVKTLDRVELRDAKRFLSEPVLS